MVKLQVIGNLGKDCVVNNVQGKSVINFSVAHTEKYKDAQGVQQSKTLWVECAYWTDRTTIAPYLKSGTMVFAEGTPEVRTYTTKEGRTGSSLAVRVVSVQLLGGNKDNQNQNQGGGYAQSVGNPQGNYVAQNSNNIPDTEDLPF